MKGLYFAKSWFTKRLNLFVKLAVRKNLSPDLFTWIGVAGALLASLGLINNLWFLVGLGLIVRLGGANLDGAVARAQGSSSKFGFILNEVGDRLSDFILMASVVALAWSTHSSATLILAIIALATSTLPTLISISGAGAGASRINGGPFGKTERCATLFILSVTLAFGLPKSNYVSGASVLIVVGSVVTAFTRAMAYKRELDYEKTFTKDWLKNE